MSPPDEHPSAKAPGLIQALGPWTACAIVVGTVIGSGIFKKPAEIARHLHAVGPVAIVWVLGGILSLCGALALAEVAVLFPKAGGMYVYIREAYGRAAAFLYGWIDLWLMRGAALAALATVFIDGLHDLLRAFYGVGGDNEVFGFWTQRWLTVAIIMSLTIVNVLGVRWGGLLQLFITSVKVLSLVAIAVLPFVLWNTFPESSPHRPSVDNLTPIWSDKTVSLSGIGSALLGVLWAYDGWYNVTPVAAEVRDPNRNLPIALVRSVFIVMAVYLAANLGYALVISQHDLGELGKSTTVVGAFGARLLGPPGMALAAAAVIISTFGALNGNVLVGPRVFFAMGADGLAPRAWQRIDPRFQTPAIAIVSLALWACLLVLASGLLLKIGVLRPDKSLFDVLSDLALFGTVVFVNLAVGAIFVFRRRLPDVVRPYRCWGYPLTPLIAIGMMTGVAVNMFFEQTVEALAGAGAVAIGATVYAIFLRRVG